MKKILLLICLSAHYCMYAQPGTITLSTISNEKDSLRRYLDSTLSDHCKNGSGVVLSPQAVNKSMNQYFSLALTGKETVPVGTSASLSVSNNETLLTLGVTKMVGKYLVSAGTTLNIKDKTGAIFSNNTINPGVNANARISKTTAGKKIKYDAEKCKTYLIELSKDTARFLRSYEMRRYQVLDAQERLVSIDNFIDSFHKLSAYEKIKLAGAYQKKLAEKESVLEIIQKMATMKELKSELKDSLCASELRNAPITSQRLGIISFITAYGSEHHQLFDGTKAASLFSADHNRYKIGMEYMLFYERTSPSGFGRTRIFTIGASLVHDNNIRSFSAAEGPVTLITEHNDTIRTKQEVDKPIVFDVTNSSFRQYMSFIANARYTFYYGEKRTIGLDLFSDISANKFQSGPLLSVGTGLILNIPSAEDKKTSISFELYYKLVDVTQRLPNSKGKFHERNEIGFTTAVPLSKLVTK